MFYFYQNAFGGRAPPRTAGGAPSWIKGEEGWEGRESGEERKGKDPQCLMCVDPSAEMQFIFRRPSDRMALFNLYCWLYRKRNLAALAALLYFLLIQTVVGTTTFDISLGRTRYSYCCRFVLSHPACPYRPTSYSCCFSLFLELLDFSLITQVVHPAGLCMIIRSYRSYLN